MSTNKVGWQGKTPPNELLQQVMAARLAGKTPREVTEIAGLSAQTHLAIFESCSPRNHRKYHSRASQRILSSLFC
jgi:hypothetical protein